MTGCRVACCFWHLGRGRLWHAVAAVDGLPVCLLSGVPCHSGGLWLAGSDVVFPNLQPPLFVPVECGWMGLDWLVGFGWVLSCFWFLWSSGPLFLWHPASYWTAALFLG